MVLIEFHKERQIRINPELTKTTHYFYLFKNCCKEIWLLSVQNLQNYMCMSFHSWTTPYWLILASYVNLPYLEQNAFPTEGSVE